MLNFKTVNIITLVLVISLFVFEIFTNTPWYYYVIIGFWWLLITALGSSIIKWNYHFNSLNSNPSIQSNSVSITFDDGPNPKYTPQVLEILNTYNAKATFFCIGKNIEEHPEIFKAILKEGHSVGNHTYSHANNFGFFKSQKIQEELNQTNSIVMNLTGLTMNLYRPAFGVTNPRIKKALKTMHFKSIGWNKRSFDTTNLSEGAILKRITKNLKKGDVILLHDSSEKTLRVLEQLLLFLQQNNLQSVTIDNLFNVKPYA